MRAAALLALACAGSFGCRSLAGPADLACDDLSHPSTDPLTCVGPPTVEDCFDGLDNDCNGLADCADPACAELAECVPEAPGFVLGARVEPEEDCPTHYGGGETLLGQGLEVPGGCDGCGCTPSLVCRATLDEQPRSMCKGTSQRSWTVDSASCNTGDPPLGLDLATGAVHIGAMRADTACAPAGNPTPAPLQWTRQARFCATPRVGGGCALGWSCVPHVAHHCALAPGGVPCGATYAAEGGASWYAGADDQRDCGGTCACSPPNGGSCGHAVVNLYGSTLCLGFNDVAAPGGYACLLDAPLRSARVMLTDPAQPACAVANAARGTAVATGEQTLCCL